MQKLGITAPRVRDVKEVAGDLRGQQHEHLRPLPHVIWYNNLNNLCFTTNPNNPPNLFDNTAFALLEIPAFKRFPGYPPIQ